MSWFCKHKWKIERERIPPPIEALLKRCEELSLERSTSIQFFEEKLVTDLICEKCGKHKHYVD
jgi:hypothetical protein